MGTIMLYAPSGTRESIEPTRPDSARVRPDLRESTPLRPKTFLGCGECGNVIAGGSIWQQRAHLDVGQLHSHTSTATELEGSHEQPTTIWRPAEPGTEHNLPSGSSTR